MTHTSYIVTIEGKTWSGVKGSMDFEFNHKPTRKEVDEVAGDFETWGIHALRKKEVKIEYVNEKLDL